MKEFGLEKIIFDTNDSCDNFSLIRLLYMHRWSFMHLWADNLLPQLLMEQFDTLPLQYRHIEHMHEGVWLKKNFFGPIISYHSF